MKIRFVRKDEEVLIKVNDSGMIYLIHPELLGFSQEEILGISRKKRNELVEKFVEENIKGK